MKQVKQFLFLLSLFFLVTCTVVTAQDLPQSQEFPLGAFLGAGSPGVLTSFDSSGFNTAAWKSYADTKSFLDKYKVIAQNNGTGDWISYYATCYYSRWQGEQDAAIEHVGSKHKYGQDTTWHDTLCWSSLGVSAPAESLMYGPHYRQDQRYKSYAHTGSIWGVDYVPRFNLALDNPHSLNPDKNICVIKVVYRYAAINKPGYFYEFVMHDTTFLQDTLKISDFPPNGSFKYFYASENDTNWYRYPDKFHSTISGDRAGLSPSFPDTISLPPDSILRYEDIYDDNGIQFCVDYLGNDSTTLFIDFAEVYDNAGWDDFTGDPFSRELAIQNIQSYAQSYSEWQNIIYWYGQDEPYSIDSYLPIHIVDSLVQSVGGAPVTQYFQPDWRILVNGDSQMVDYYKISQPPELIIDPYPFSPAYYPVRWEDLESLRQEFQIANSLKPGFWFVGQSFGRLIDGEWSVWRLPDSTELKSSIMLSLAHGAKGILFWIYDSHPSEYPVYYVGMVGENGEPSDLYHFIHNNLAPRLKGALGNTLLSINYTGEYLELKQVDSPTGSVSFDYLTLTYNNGGNIFLDAGFFTKNNQPDNDYFLLANLTTYAEKTVTIDIDHPVNGRINQRFRNIEGGLDTTFTNSITTDYTFPAGEGYLFQVAPVVLYGGRLIYNETVSTATLWDDLIIENGATLTVNGTYTANGNIIVKDGGSLKTLNGGTVNFMGGHKLIIEGLASVKGTAAQKLF